MYKPGTRILLTVKEVAELTGWSKSFLYDQINKGMIPVVRFGRSVRIPSDWVDALTAGLLDNWKMMNGAA